MDTIKIKSESFPARCEICHKDDCFVRELNYCSRCEVLNNPKYFKIISSLSNSLPVLQNFIWLDIGSKYLILARSILFIGFLSTLTTVSILYNYSINSNKINLCGEPYFCGCPCLSIYEIIGYPILIGVFIGVLVGFVKYDNSISKAGTNNQGKLQIFIRA